MSTLFAIHSGFATGVDLYSLLVKKENLKEVIKIFSEYGYYIVE